MSAINDVFDGPAPVKRRPLHELLDAAQAKSGTGFVYGDVKINSYGTHVVVFDAEPVEALTDDGDEVRAPQGDVIVAGSGADINEAVANAERHLIARGA